MSDGSTSLTVPRPNLIADVKAHFAERRNVIFGLVALLLVVYGFELFNFNLTIDEELHAASFDPAQWVSQRRWGMYVVNRLLFPYTVVPVVPLAFGLGLHLLGTLLLLKAWNVVPSTDQFLVGALSIATPTIAYMYTFATIGYGVGAGLFLVALSLVLFRRSTGPGRYLAAIPAGFAFALYQTFALALMCVFTVSLVRDKQPEQSGRTLPLIHVAGVGIAAAAIYAIGQAVFMAILNEARSDYVERLIDIEVLRDRAGEVLRAVVAAAGRVYRGDPSVYAHAVWALPLLVVLLFASFAGRIPSLDRRPLRRLALLSAFPLVMISPFLGGVISGGNMSLRFLVALPFALAGLMALSMPTKRRPRMLITVTTAIVLLQFAISTNSLFGASHLALQQDRAMATRLIHEIETAMAQAATPPQYLEVVGRPSRGTSPLVPLSETFGASFFEWGGGSVGRIVRFVETLGFDELSPLPVEFRDRYVGLAAGMPAFPAEGSVVVEGEAVVVKFGPYTYAQTSIICGYNPEVSICSP